MQEYVIHPLLTAIIKKPATAGPLFPDVPGIIVESPVMAFLVTGGPEPVLVDTGPPPPEISKLHHYEMAKDEALLLPNHLKKHGLRPEDIRLVVNTHLHWDHCWYNDLFPKADICVQKRELPFAANPIPSHYLFYDAFQMGLVPAWTRAAARFKVIDGDCELLPGLKLVALPGHTPGSMGLLTETAAGPHLIAGDAVPTVSAWEKREFGLPVPSGIHVDLAEYYETLKRMMDMEATVVTSHDFKSVVPFFPIPHQTT
jgi:glyoxylase-like metal-dependent hydrolase (beta-lactamase superfamily II)